MSNIFPSLLDSDICELNALLMIFKEKKIDWLHIDVMDGQFVTDFGFNLRYVQQLKANFDFLLDCHLMVDDPERWIRIFSKVKVDMITIHIESTPHINAMLNLIRSFNIRTSVAINPGTSIVTLAPILFLVDNILVMTVNPGKSEKSPHLETLSTIKWLVEQKHNNAQFKYTIQVDGAINDETIGVFAKAGVDIFVSGSYIVRPTQLAGAKIESLQKRIDEVSNYS